MPVELKSGLTPRGHKVLISRTSGTVSAADAQLLVDAVAPGAPHAGCAVHATIDKGAQYTPEARRTFTAGGEYSFCAIVVSSTILKTIINFIMMVTNRDNRAKMFDSDQAAMAWLDEMLDKKALTPSAALRRSV